MTECNDGTFIDIAICGLPKTGNTVEVIAKVRRGSVDQVARIEIVAPGIAVHTWTRSRHYWPRCRMLELITSMERSYTVQSVQRRSYALCSYLLHGE